MAEKLSGLVDNLFEAQRAQREKMTVKTKTTEEQLDELTNMIDDALQKIKSDAGKPRLTLVPRPIIYDIAAVLEYGRKKYPNGGPDNWKKVDPQRYRDAAFRHFMAYLDDPYGVDEESGLPHRWHLECNLAFLAELEGKKASE